LLVYKATKSEFMADVDNDIIVARIAEAFEDRLRRANAGEVRSWNNSMQYMYMVLNSADIPDRCGVAIEFVVPYTSSAYVPGTRVRLRGSDHRRGSAG
jgi:hypothetical protein